MTKTTRVVIDLDDAEKAELERQARMQGCSIAELVHRRALALGDNGLVELLARLKNSISRANEALDRTLAHSAHVDAEAPARKAATIAAARAEFSDVDMAAFAALLFPDPEDVAVSDSSYATEFNADDDGATP